MINGEPGGAGPGGPASGARVGATLGASFVAFLLLPTFLFHLAWFNAGITDRRECDRRVTLGCGPEHMTLLWIGTFLVFVTGSLCLVLTWVRMRRGGRWWPWPVATVTILAGWAVVQQVWLF